MSLPCPLRCWLSPGPCGPLQPCHSPHPAKPARRASVSRGAPPGFPWATPRPQAPVPEREAPPPCSGSPLRGTLSPLLGSQPSSSGKGTSIPLVPSIRFQGLPLGVPSQPASCAQSYCAWRGRSEVGAFPPPRHQPPLGSHVHPPPTPSTADSHPSGHAHSSWPTRASWEPGALSELPGPSRGPWLTARSLARV